MEDANLGSMGCAEESQDTKYEAFQGLYPESLAGEIPIPG